MANPFDLISRVLNDWGSKQKRRLVNAFSVGGHRLHGGKQWAPLKRSTGRTPLVNTWAMRNAMFFKASGVSVIVGNRSSYVIYHQNGTRSIPKRPVVVITKKDLSELKSDLKKSIEQQMRTR